MSDIPVELSLDVTAALAAIDQIDSALQSAATNFQSTIDSSLASLDIPAVDVPIAVDTTAVDNLDATLQEAAGGVVVPVDADTSAAVEQIGALEAEPVVVPVEADTSQAQDALSQLGETVGGTGANFEQFGEQARGAFEGAAAAVTGNLRGMTGALKGFGPEVAGAAVAVSTLAEVGHVFFENAIEAEAAQQRFNTTLGVAAGVVDRIDIGGLNVSLHELAASLGSTTEGLQNAASSIFQLGESAGAPADRIAETTKQIEALAARAVALDPSLGQVGDVAERMLTGLARGGRFAAQFKLSLTAVDITNEALRENLGKTADQLTIYDKAAAGATLATQNLGGHIATDIATGSKNVAVQLNVIKEKFHEVLEETGKPLLGPTLDLLNTAEPALAAVAESFGAILQVVIPLADALLSALVPALEAVAPLLQLVAKGASLLGTAMKISLLPVTGPLSLIEKGVGAIGDKFSDTKAKSEDGAAAVSGALLQVTSLFQGLGSALKTGEALGDSFRSVETAIAPVTAKEAELRAETVRLAVALANGTANERDFRRAFLGSGLDVGAFTDSVKQVIAQRDQLASSFDQGLPSIGDAFTVEASKVSAGATKIDKSFQVLVDASSSLRERFTQGLPSIADAFTEGVNPEDLAKAQDTLESFIQGVEGVSKSAADAAQAVIDKAAVQGGTGLAGFLDQLKKQTADIAAFQSTLDALRGRGANDLAATFAEKGLDSSAIAAEAAGLTDAQLAAAEQTVEQSKQVRNQAVSDMGLFADQLVATFGPKGAEAGTVFGEGLVTSLADPAIIARAREAAAAIGEATTAGAGQAAAAQPQTLSGFLAALKSQTGDIKAFQDNLDTITRNGGQVLSDTLREQGITAANAAAQAAALAPTQLQAAEQAVRDAQTALGQAEADNKAAADRLIAFQADTAARAAGAFHDNFFTSISDFVDSVRLQIINSPNVLAADAATAGALVGASYGGALSDAITKAITDGGLGGILLGAPGSSVTPPPANVVIPTNRFGGQAPDTSFTTGGPTTRAEANAVIIENLNVTPPRDVSADEQANAISESLTWRLRGAR